MIEKVKTAVFPVGGFGTRFLPATKAVPKELLPIVDKPLIQYAFEEATNAGIENFIFITARNKESIANHFDHAYELQETLKNKGKDSILEDTKGWLPEPGNIAFIRQQEPAGLGHSILCAKNFIGNEPFVVILPDEIFKPDGNPFLKDMMDIYAKKGGNVIGVSDVPKNKISKYGIIDPESDDGKIIKIKGMVEKPLPEEAPSNISIAGPYILQYEIFDYLENGIKAKDNEIQLTDALNTMQKNIPTHGVRFFGRRFDCGSRHGYIDANIAFALDREDMKENVLDVLRHYENEQ